MARFGEQKLTRPGFSLRGRVYQYDGERGVVVASWPKHKPRQISADEQFARDLFREAMQALKMISPEIQTYARNNAQGTPMLPRDALLAALYGRGPTIYMMSGEVYRPMPNRINISELLDNLSGQPGTMMFRGKNLWLPIPPGKQGQKLTFATPEAVPTWEDAPTGPYPKATLVARTTDAAPNTTWPKYCTFQSPIYDDLGIWNPATPDRLIVPAGAQRVRLHANAQITSANVNQGSSILITNSADNANYPGAARAANVKATGTFTDDAASIMTAWLPASASPYYRLRYNIFPTRSANFLANSSLMMEVQF